MADTLISTEKSSNDKTINIYMADDLKTSAAHDFFTSEYSALIKTGAVLEKFLKQINRHQALYADIDGTIVGMIAFKMQSPDSAWLTLAVVDPIYRKDGIFGMLYEIFEQHLAGNGITTINSLVDTNNSAMITAMQKHGFETGFFRVSKKI